MVYATFDGIIEIHYVLAFLTATFATGVIYSTINSEKCVVATILHIPTYPSINSHPLVKNCTTGISNLRPPKTKLNNI